MKTMELEARNFDAGEKKRLLDKCAAYKKDQSDLKLQFDRVKDESQRSQLIGAKSGNQRGELMSTTHKIDEQNRMLENSLRAVAETEEVAGDISEELMRNREKIESVAGKVGRCAIFVAPTG
jgi:hypothetical protein